MTKEQFLDAVRARLAGRTPEEIERVSAYYAELIDDSMEDGLTEQEAVAALGSVDEAVSQSVPGLPAPAAAPGRMPWWGVLGIVAVAVMAAVVFSRVGGFLGGLAGGQRVEERTYDLSPEAIESIEVDVTDCDVRVAEAGDGVCRVVCRESEKYGSAVEVRGGTLTITRRDERPWYAHLGLWWGRDDLSVTVYLPAGEYDALELITVSGEIDVAEAFRFSEAALTTTSGDISFAGGAAGTLSAGTVSGDVRLETVSAERVYVTTTSGDILLSETGAGALNVSTTSGEVAGQHVLVSGAAQIETVSGDVLFRDADAGSLRVRTISGDVGAALRSAKRFTTHTVSGEVTVPPSDPGAGQCEITTTSGDINVGYIFS